MQVLYFATKTKQDKRAFLPFILLTCNFFILLLLLLPYLYKTRIQGKLGAAFSFGGTGDNQ
jgi:hypothetical protein